MQAACREHRGHQVHADDEPRAVHVGEPAAGAAARVEQRAASERRRELAGRALLEHGDGVLCVVTRGPEAVGVAGGELGGVVVLLHEAARGGVCARPTSPSPVEPSLDWSVRP